MTTPRTTQIHAHAQSINTHGTHNKASSSTKEAPQIHKSINNSLEKSTTLASKDSQEEKPLARTTSPTTYLRHYHHHGMTSSSSSSSSNTAINKREFHTPGNTVKPFYYTRKDDPIHLANYRPIALANTIYKLYTSTLTTLLTNYDEQHRLLHFSQEGFRPQRNTSRQIQIILAALEDAKLTTQDIYLTYIDFRNAFGSIDHARLFALMEDLGYPLDAIEIVGNIYENSSTSFTGSHFGTTPPIKISRGTIQGDTLSPYLFIIFLEPLLRWLEKDEAGYHFKTSPSTYTTTIYVDDLAILTDDIQKIQPQITKLQQYAEWSYMDLTLSKCAITGCPNKSKLKPNTFRVYIQSQNITYKTQTFLILTQNEPYIYLGIQLTPSLKWNLQKR